MKVVKLGFIINPVAGMGGSVGLKGTDGKTYLEAVKLGATRITPLRAKKFFSSLKRGKSLSIYSAPGVMGEEVIKQFDFSYSVVEDLKENIPTTSNDTKRILKKLLSEKIDLLVFVGGDGTARDIYDVIGLSIPVIGVPSGVKMFSSVFAVNPQAAAEIVDAFIMGESELVEGEVLDINEESFRQGKLDVTLYGYLQIPQVHELVQMSKEPARSGGSYEENKEALARYVAENMVDDTLYILGPGSTIKAVADKLQVDKMVLGIEALYKRKIVDKHLNEEKIVQLLNKFSITKIIVSPIGGQGFIFGRGNKEFTPPIIKRVGKENIIVVATRDKMSKLPYLRVDTGDTELDQSLRGYIKVVIDYNEEVVVKIK